MPASAPGVPGPSTRQPREPVVEGTTGALDDLRRYAGWLGRDYTATAVRADIVALDDAVTTGMSTFTQLRTLDADIARLPAGGIRPLLRKAAVSARASIERGDRAGS